MSSMAKQSTSKIKRGTAPARKPRAVVKSKRAARTQGPNQLDKVLLALRITPVLVRKATTALLLSVGIALALVAASFIGLPRMAATAFAEGVARAGFVVKRVEITGLEHMDRMTVYGITLDQHSMSMANVDLNGVRQKLLGYGWIADARVTRRLPDTLVVDIEERKAAAVWQHAGKLALVDGQGIVLEPVTPANMPADVPLVIGPDANTQSAAMASLLSHAPRLKPMIAGATWVGNRRWDLRFQTGETLALPEGETAAAAALVAFAQKDAAHPLLGKGYARFDTRDGAHIIVKLKPDKPRTETSADGSPATSPAASVTGRHAAGSRVG
jgi:cell division protein FtsQ